VAGQRRIICPGDYGPLVIGRGPTRTSLEKLPRLAIIISAAMCALLLSTPHVWAQTRTAPEATQHALDELANAIAQGKITRTPTPSATAPAAPTSTPGPPPPTLQPPTDTPRPVPGVAQEPALPVPNVGQAVAAYVRPSPRDPSGNWLELALPSGRWAILYDSVLCTPPAPWTNVWLALDDQSDRPITADRAGDGAMCAVAHWSWSSDVPCAADDRGTCDVALDGAYWDAIPQLEPAATDTPIPLPVPSPPASPVRAPTPPAVPRPAPAAPPPAAAPQVEVVVQTVVVVITAAPPTPVPTRTPPPPTATPPSATQTPLPTTTATVEPTFTQVPAVAADLAPSETPTVVPQTDAPASLPSAWNWTLTFVLVGAVLGLVAIWLFVARSGPLMW
jgi:hypothetical protein